jgi:hypothetical protein
MSIGSRVLVIGLARLGVISQHDLDIKNMSYLTKRILSFGSRVPALVVCAVLTSAVAGCTSVIQYQPRSMDVASAKELIDKLTMTQHPAWKPDYIEFNDTYVQWGYGAVTTGSGTGTVVGGLAVSSGRSSTRSVGDRVYYNDVREIQLLDWTRKGKQWYVVSSLSTRGDQTHLFRTRHIEDAQQYVDAIRTVMRAYGN